MTKQDVKNKKVLFIPVSSPKGSGEYIRSLAVAQGLFQTFENVDIKFIVNRNAVYAGKSSFEFHLIDRSPTMAVKAVKDIIKLEKPDLCIFDSSGRTSIFRMLKRMGIPIVFISSRKRPRKKAFSPKWLPYITQHWIAQPTFAQGPLTRWECLKLKLFGTNPPFFLETLFPIPVAGKRIKLKQKIGLKNEPFIVFASGGGGMHNKGGKQAPEIFSKAATRLAHTIDEKCVAVMGPNYSGKLPEEDGVIWISSLANDEFIELIHDAEMLVIGGGSILAQGLVNKKVCVAVPTAGDQFTRIRKAEKLGLVKSAALDEEEISNTVLMLLKDRGLFQKYQKKVISYNMTNGLPRAMDNIATLLLDNSSPRS